MRIDFPDKLKNRGGTVAIVIPKQYCDLMGIEPDHPIQVGIRKNDKQWILTASIPTGDLIAPEKA